MDLILYLSTPEEQISELFIYSSLVWDISAHYPLAGPLNLHLEMRTSWLNKQLHMAKKQETPLQS